MNFELTRKGNNIIKIDILIENGLKNDGFGTIIG
jgi:hypothetical protein